MIYHYLPITVQIQARADEPDYLKLLQEVQLFVQAEIARVGAEAAKKFPLYNVHRNNEEGQNHNVDTDPV